MPVASENGQKADFDADFTDFAVFYPFGVGVGFGNVTYLVVRHRIRL